MLIEKNISYVHFRSWLFLQIGTNEKEKKEKKKIEAFRFEFGIGCTFLVLATARR